MVEFLLSITDNGPQKVLQLFEKRDLINNTKIRKEDESNFIFKYA